MKRNPTPPAPGTLYRVRDKNYPGRPGKVWAEGIPHDQAQDLVRELLAGRKSKTVRAEPITAPATTPASADDLSVDNHFDTTDVDATSDGDPIVENGVRFELVDDQVYPVTVAGTVVAIPDGHELVVDGQVRSLPAAVDVGQVMQVRALDAEIARAQAAARAAVRSVVASAQARPTYRDKTVVREQPRSAPPPPDKTVSRDPTFIRLGTAPAAKPEPPESPLKVAVETDGPELPDDALSETDLHDLDIGGGPSAADLAHAEAERDASGS